MTISLNTILNVAIIGVGEVAMVTHLPTLMLCSHMFKTVALVDISKDSLAHCAKKFHVPATYTDVGEMLKGSPEVDLVMIMNANEYHASANTYVIHAVQCLNAGKHVLIEKPMALTKSGADEIEAARKKSGKVAFVGYQRRFAGAFLRTKELVEALPKDSINYVRVRDIIGWNSMVVEQCGAFPGKFTDFPPEAGTERQALNAQLFNEALGPKAANPLDKKTWHVLNALATHDMSVMRELLGMPIKCLAATRNPAGFFTSVIFQYPNFNAYFEIGVDNVIKFDAEIEIYAQNKHIKLNYDTPYIKGLPITATVVERKPNGDHSEELIRPTYEDAYTLEYKALYDAIVNGAEVRNGPLDAKQDLEIFTMIMDAMI